jgi:hypothetical protein
LLPPFRFTSVVASRSPRGPASPARTYVKQATSVAGGLLNFWNRIV